MRFEVDPNSDGKYGWEACAPNRYTSDCGLAQDMFFGRAIPVPG